MVLTEHLPALCPDQVLCRGCEQRDSDGPLTDGLSAPSL